MKPEIQSISFAADIHARAGGHYFDLDTLRFFRSRPGSHCLVYPDGWVVWPESVGAGFHPSAGRKYRLCGIAPGGGMEGLAVRYLKEYASSRAMNRHFKQLAIGAGLVVE
jgi:hypothetical protein